MTKVTLSELQCSHFMENYLVFCIFFWNIIFVFLYFFSKLFWRESHLGWSVMQSFHGGLFCGFFCIFLWKIIFVFFLKRNSPWIKCNAVISWRIILFSGAKAAALAAQAKMQPVQKRWRISRQRSELYFECLGFHIHIQQPYFWLKTVKRHAVIYFFSL